MEWIKKHKEILLQIIVFFLFFVSGFFISHVFRSITCDEVWSYGFSYNISQGMIIYKDFNVLQTPLYFMIASLFIKVFGPYYLSIVIFSSLLTGMIGVFLFQKIRWKAFLALIPFLFFTPSPYNILCTFLFFLILFLYSREKDYDLWIAFLVGLLFVTKQHVGFVCFFPMMFYSRGKVKSFFAFLSPFLFFSLYLLLRGAFLPFIDYSFFGLFDFGESNTNLNYFFVILEGLVVFYLCYRLWKSKFQDKEAFYILMFQIMTVPIFDQGHFFVAFFPFFYYFLKEQTKFLLYGTSSFFVFFFCICYYALVFGHVHMEKDLLFLKAPDEVVSYLREVYDYFDGDLSHVYANSEFSYLLKLYYQEPIGPYDLLMNGNMGTQKEEMFSSLQKHCQEETCYFLIIDDQTKQFSSMTQFVEEHYEEVGSLRVMKVYTSRKN